MLAGWEAWQLAVAAVGVLLLGMSKGGFPIGTISLPLLILVWPDHGEPAKQVVGFLLPVLCAMDIVAVCFYRRHIMWRRILPLLPGTVLGVILASVLFLGESSALSFSDRWLKLAVGLIGVLFVLYRLLRHRITARPDPHTRPSWRLSGGLGVAAGVTSTLAHAAGPVAQMYFLPQGLAKMNLAANLIGFFWLLNLIKLIPFALLGRLELQNLALAGLLLPLAPIGVGCGFLIVRRLPARSYVGLIYALLLVTSLVLVVKAL